MEREAKERELAALRSRIQELEAELGREPDANWPPRAFYVVYHALAGFVLGMFGAATSLLFNVVGSLMVHQSPLRLIEVYLTFPLGKPWADAIGLTPGVPPTEQLPALTLAVGCCLYLGTGMMFGMIFHLVLSRWFEHASFARQFLVVTVMGLSLWLVNYYGILSWLQPLLFGRAWIVENIPWWVAALTHLVFAWTMVLVQPLGRFVARPNPTENA